MNDAAGDGTLGRQVLLLRQEFNALRDHVMQMPRPSGLRDLANALVDVDKRMGDFDGRIRDLGKRLDELVADEAARGDKPTVWDWSVLLVGQDGPDFHEAWTQLQAWVEGVLGGLYGVLAWEDPKQRIASASAGPLARKIPPCWPHHPDLIAELGWLCQEWLQIYRTAKGTPARAGDWHDRYLVGLRKRIASSTAATCRSSHLDEPGGRY